MAIKNIMGEVEFRRDAYGSRSEDRQKVYVRLLDEALEKTLVWVSLKLRLYVFATTKRV